ncbi:hypothetical protein ABIB25_000666 [Nakamurella sp. UYEF19]|uniref:hypothetical protein n=1 Tax=Nakamurella sp. UYEF19 TaxID=1756392 RepID=UPI0033965A9E
MNDQDLLLHRRLAAIAEDAPSGASLVRAEHAGYHRRLRRRRWYAAGSVGVVVLVVTGTTTLLGPGLFTTPHEASAPAVTATLGPRASASTTALAANSRLVPFAGVAVTSPVSVPASWVSYDHDGPDVQSGPSSLLVNWTGKEPTARQTIDVRSGTTGTGQYRGYLITVERPTLDVFAPGYDTKAVSTPITVSGHPAQLLTAPKGSFDNTYAAPVEARIAWQLGDGRWIQVWTVGESNTVLTAFASAITDKPTDFPANLSIGLTLKGYTVADSTLSSYVSQMTGPGLTLCAPTKAASAAPASSAAVVSAGDASSSAGSDNGNSYGNCLSMYANVADGGFGAGIVLGNESNAKFVADSVGVDVGGIPVRVNAEYQTAWTRWGKATIVVQSPGGVTLTTTDLAALAASVRLAPTLGVKDEPNPLVESSLAQESAAAATESQSTR